jgi:hypothetical protein
MKLRNIILSLSIASMAFLASCGDKASSSPKPTISLKAGAGYTSNSGKVSMDSVITFNVLATAGSDAMKNIVITAKLANGSTKTLLDTALITKNIDFTKSIANQGGVGDVVEYTFTANDNNGTSNSVSISITVIPVEASLSSTVDQRVYNALATGFNSAYNLETGQALTAGTPDFVPGKKDIVDKTTTGAAQWANTWGSGNGSKFVKCTTNDFGNAQGTGYLYELWIKGKATATDQISGMKVGDVYLVKTGQAVSFGLYLLKITQITDLPAAGNNNDYITFDYLKYTP